jgi:hypothetical protein
MGFRKNLPRSACGIFPESLAQSGTGQRGRQEIKYRLTSREMFNSKIKRYEQKQLHPDEKVPRNHWTLWSEADGSRDKPPESIFRRPETFRLLSAAYETLRLPVVETAYLSLAD